MTSAEKALGMDSQPFTTLPPRDQIVLSVFSRTSLLLVALGASVATARAGV
jgi:hypothetical protein